MAMFAVGLLYCAREFSTRKNARGKQIAIPTTKNELPQLGVFRSVRDAFKFEGARKLHEVVVKIHEIHNTYVGHQKTELIDTKLAAQELKRWIEGLLIILKAAATK